MRVAVKSLIYVWAAVTVVSLGGLVYVFPGYSLDAAFSEALREPPSRQGVFWFRWCIAFVVIGVCMISWLYRTYRKRYGKF